MPSAFFVSSAGDTDLAKATIAQMRATGVDGYQYPRKNGAEFRVSQFRTLS